MAKSGQARLSIRGLQNDKTQVLGGGFDNVMLTSQVGFSPDMRDDLLALKDMASRLDEPQSVGSPLTFLNDTLWVKPHSRRSWPLVLHNDWIEMDAGRGGASGVMVRARLSSLAMSAFSEEAAQVMQDWAFANLGPDAILQVSEAHLYLDVTGIDFAGLYESGALMAALVSRAHHVTPHLEHRKLTGLTLGLHGSDCQMVIYRKDVEIAKSHKGYKKQEWLDAGWDGESPVWRIEFRVRRGMLRQSQINDVVQLIERAHDLWEYGLSHFARLTEAVAGMSARDRERSPVATWWAVVVDGFRYAAGLGRIVRDRTAKSRVEKLLPQLAGVFKSVMAHIVGSENWTPEEYQTFIWRYAVAAMVKRRRKSVGDLIIETREKKLAWAVPVASVA